MNSHAVKSKSRKSRVPASAGKRQLPMWPYFSASDIAMVKRVLESGKVNYWTGGAGIRFEKAFAEWSGAKYAFAVSSGTAALHLALESLGVGEGDEVICTPYSFRASATAAQNAGAKVVFADVGRDHMLDAETIAPRITARTKAIVVVHLYGQVAEMGPILKLARKHGIKVVEDCAQCLGGEYCGVKTGLLGDAGCFSFCQNKHITCGGEGGMIVCKSSFVAKNIRSLRDHGWIPGSSPKRYDRIGYNFRMTEMQSVLGLGQLARLDSWNLPRRRALAKRFINALAPSPLIVALPVDTAQRRASFYLVPFVLDKTKLKVSVPKFIEALQAETACAYRILWPLMSDEPVAASLLSCTVGFWVHPVYSRKIVDEAVKAFYRMASLYSK